MLDLAPTSVSSNVHASGATPISFTSAELMRMAERMGMPYQKLVERIQLKQKPIPKGLSNQTRLFGAINEDYWTSKPVRMDRDFSPVWENQEIAQHVDEDSLHLFMKIGSYNEVLPAITFLEDGGEEQLDFVKREFSRFVEMTAVAKNRFLSKERMTVYKFGMDYMEENRRMSGQDKEDPSLYVPTYSKYHYPGIFSERQLRSDFYDKLLPEDISTYYERGLKSMIRAIIPTLLPVKRDNYHKLYEKVLKELGSEDVIKEGGKSFKDIYLDLNTTFKKVDGRMKKVVFDDESWEKLKAGGGEISQQLTEYLEKESELSPVAKGYLEEGKRLAKEVLDMQTYSRYAIRNTLIGLRELGIVKYGSRKYRLSDDALRYMEDLQRPVDLVAESSPTGEYGSEIRTETVFSSVSNPIRSYYTEFAGALERQLNRVWKTNYDPWYRADTQRMLDILEE